MNADRTSVILADSQYLIRYALKQIAVTELHLSLLAEVTSETALLDQLKNTTCPDIIIMDYFEAGFQLESVQKVKSICPEVSIIVISSDNNKANILQVLEWGVNGFLTKSCDKQEIRDAINASIKKDKFFCANVLDHLLEKSFGTDRHSNTPSILSKREVEVVQLVAKGLVAKEIAALLNLSPHTVYTHRKKIMKKLGLKSASELVRYALQHGLIPLE